MSSADNLFTDNVAERRFERVEQDQIVFADYRRQEGRLVILYVEAPTALRGTGAAGRLMQDIAAVARRDDLPIEPRCGYAAAWLRRHPGAAEVI